MADIQQLLQRISLKDKKALKEYMQLRGPALYDRLYERLGDKEQADQVFIETIRKFYAILAIYPEHPSDEALLFACGDALCRKQEQAAQEKLYQATLKAIPDEQPAEAPAPPKKRKRKGGLVVLIVLLALVLLFGLWALWGIAVKEGLPLPALDLGHHWFNLHIFPIF